MSRFSLEARFTANAAKFNRTVASMEGRFKRFARGLRSGLRKADAAAGAMHNAFKRVAVGAAAAAAAGGVVAKSVIDAGADFEEAITAVGAVGLQTRDQISSLENKAKELGATTKFTASEAANAMEIMARAGFKNEEILSGVSGVLDAAAASGLEMAEVADHVSNVLKGMGLETSEATRVADVLALASSKTNSSIGSLGESMRNVASTARQLGVPLESAVAGVAALQDVGLDASVAGSAMNTMLTKLAKPPAAVAAQMKKFGVSFKDAKGNMLPLQKVIEQISIASNKAGGNFDQVAFLADLVGLRGQKAAANLKDLFESGKLTTLTDQLQNAEGAAKKMAALKMDNFKGDMTLLGSAVDAVKVKLFETQGAPLRGLVQGMTKWVGENEQLITSKFVDFVNDTKKKLPEIAKWAKRIGVGLAVFYTFAAAVKVASVAVAAFEIATKAAAVVGRIFTSQIVARTAAVIANTAVVVASTVATWAKVAATKVMNAALALAQLATSRVTATTIASTAASGANTVATWARNAAHTAFNLVSKAGAALVAAYSFATSGSTVKTIADTVATVARKVAQIALNTATGLGTAATNIYAIARGRATAATVAGTAATTAGAAAMKALAVSAGAAAAAVGAVMLAMDQANKLASETEGLGVTGTIGEMWKRGTFDPFEAVDAFQNEQAIKRSKERQALASRTEPAPVGPQERGSRQMAEELAGSGAGGGDWFGELNVNAPPGVVSVDKQPRSGRIHVPPSGGL